jgi:acetyl esterase
MKSLAILCLFLLQLAAFASGAEPTTKTFTYKKTSQAELGLKAYLPSGWNAEDKRPVIVFFFGGG